MLTKNIVLYGLSILILKSTSFALVGGDTSGQSNTTAALAQFSISFNGCTLTRISRHYFLGAAHCAKSPNGQFGEFHFFYDKSGEKKSNVLSYYRTHSYVDWTYYIVNDNSYTRPLDIMIYEISNQDIKKLQEISVAKFDFNYSPTVESEITLTGYGGYAEIIIGEDNHGNKVYKPIVDDRFRSKRQRITAFNSSYILIPQFDQTGAEVRMARGDSGGAAFNEKFQIIGVNSYVDRKSFAELVGGIARIDQQATSSLGQVQISEWLTQFTK